MENPENLYYASKIISGIHFKIISSHKGIKYIFLNEKEVKNYPSTLTKLQYDDPYMFSAFAQLEEYFNLKREKFYIPLDINGTEFQKKIWNELQKIPYGKTVSYLSIAKKIGNEKSIRAVGKANGANPVPIVIPCHRVISANGKIGGYSAGVSIKRKLLELEGSLSLELFKQEA